MTRVIETCRSCQSARLVQVLDLGELHLSAFVDKGQDTKKYPLELVLCEDCSLVQLRHTVPATEMYQNYWYRSGTNHSMTQELRDIAHAATVALNKERFTALDIGCNDGTLLRAYDVARVQTVGFEPATNLIKYAEKGVDCIIADFFHAGAWRTFLGNEKADVVTSIAMFYDLDDPNSVVNDVSKVMADDGVWVIQMADLKSMLDRNMWDNICHEHLEYYSLIALENLLERHGFYVSDIQQNDVNGGSIRAFVRKDPGRASKTVTEMRRAELQDGLDTLKPYTEFAERIENRTNDLVRFITSVRREGKKVYAYGASTKGNTLLQHAGLDSSLINAAAERNPDKLGKYTVGTHIPIISEEQARAEKPDYFLVLPWHFRNEFLSRERAYLDDGGAFIFPLPEFEIVMR
jgi:hypothetical protein